MRLRFRRDATFLTKPQLLRELESVKDGGAVVVEAADEYVDLDARETIAQFIGDAKGRVSVTVEGFELPAHAVGGH